MSFVNSKQRTKFTLFFVEEINFFFFYTEKKWVLALGFWDFGFKKTDFNVHNHEKKNCFDLKTGIWFLKNLFTFTKRATIFIRNYLGKTDSIFKKPKFSIFLKKKFIIQHKNQPVSRWKNSQKFRIWRFHYFRILAADFGKKASFFSKILWSTLSFFSRFLIIQHKNAQHLREKKLEKIIKKLLNFVQNWSKKSSKIDD